MSALSTTPMQRTMAAMSGQEPECVPLLLATSLLAARTMRMSPEDYFGSASNVVEGQSRLADKFRGDCLNPLYYAAIETEAWGGTTLFLPDGPPQCGRPFLSRSSQVDTLHAPSLAAAAGLQRSLESIAGLRQRFGESLPILGTVLSPFSLPVLQMGFAGYLDLMHDEPERMAQLMEVNEAFCVAWANAQLEAGATAIGYANPVASTTIVPRDFYRSVGYAVDQRTIGRIHGPVAFHLASGRGLAIAEEIVSTGAVAVGVSAQEDLSAWKSQAGGRLTLVGNLNGLTMRSWTPRQAEEEVRRAIARAGRGGGLLLADNHGELSWQTPDEVVLALRAATDRWGRSPLEWVGTEEDGG